MQLLNIAELLLMILIILMAACYKLWIAETQEKADAAEDPFR